MNEPPNDEYDPNTDPNWEIPQETYNSETEPETANPNLGAMDEAKRIAGQVVDVCDHNFVELSGKKYLKLEAWQAIAYAAGTVPGILIVKDNMIAGVSGVMARATLKDSKGKILSEAEGFVGSDEDFWQRQPVQSRVNMAQTRAVSRVCRLVFSFVVQIMNQEHGRAYEVTPADEMQAVMDAKRQQPAQAIAPPGQRHLMQPQQAAFMPPPFQPSNLPPQVAQPQPAPQPQQFRNYQLGAQGAQTWQGILQNVEIKFVNTPKGSSQMFIIALADGKNGTTFDKKLAASATVSVGSTVELQVAERPNKPGSYNVLGMRVL